MALTASSVLPRIALATKHASRVALPTSTWTGWATGARATSETMEGAGCSSGTHAALYARAHGTGARPSAMARENSALPESRSLTRLSSANVGRGALGCSAIARFGSDCAARNSPTPSAVEEK